MVCVSLQGIASLPRPILPSLLMNHCSLSMVDRTIETIAISLHGSRYLFKQTRKRHQNLLGLERICADRVQPQILDFSQSLITLGISKNPFFCQEEGHAEFLEMPFSQSLNLSL